MFIQDDYMLDSYHQLQIMMLVATNLRQRSNRVVSFDKIFPSLPATSYLRLEEDGAPADGLLIRTYKTDRSQSGLVRSNGRWPVQVQEFGTGLDLEETWLVLGGSDRS